MNGIIGFSGTFSFPLALPILLPAGGVMFLSDIMTKPKGEELKTKD
jgi:hypothetical protein